MADNRERETLQLFDLMFKLILKEASSTARVRFINGLFDKNYPPDSETTFAATESVSNQGERLEKLTSDMVIMIGGDAFLIEAQINDDETIAVRVFQYGFAHAVRTRQTTAGNLTTLTMPAARIIYWETTRRTPDKETVRLVFPDKTTHDYEVEALKVLDQSLVTLDRRDMALLFPFCLLKFRREVKRTAVTVERRRELAGELRVMLREMEGFLAGELREGRLSVGDAAMILERVEQMYEELYGLYPEFEEAKVELQERLRTHWQDYLQEGMQLGRQEGMQLGRQEGMQLGRQEGMQLGEKRVVELLEQGYTLEQIKRMLTQEAVR
ncbi:MAG: hypothetical protein LBK00_01220 [Treponema sp.]|jgi:hypothetical protein|nr:hypothetical protein [Treponema sp.]